MNKKRILLVLCSTQGIVRMIFR